jgi:hypothetical protein
MPQARLKQKQLKHAIANNTGSMPRPSNKVKLQEGEIKMGKALSACSESTKVHHPYPQKHRERLQASGKTSSIGKDFKHLGIDIQKVRVAILKQMHVYLPHKGAGISFTQLNMGD